MALFTIQAPPPGPDDQGEDILEIRVGNAVMLRIDAAGQLYANNGITAEGAVVHGFLALQQFGPFVLLPDPGYAKFYKDASDGQVNIYNDDGIITPLTGERAPEAKPAVGVESAR